MSKANSSDVTRASALSKAVSGDALTALVEQWRKKFPAMTAHKQSADDYWAGQCSGANKCADELEALIAAGVSAPTRWTGLMAGFARAETDRSTTNSGDTGGPTEQP